MWWRLSSKWVQKRGNELTLVWQISTCLSADILNASIRRLHPNVGNLQTKIRDLHCKHWSSAPWNLQRRVRNLHLTARNLHPKILNLHPKSQTFRKLLNLKVSKIPLFRYVFTPLSRWLPVRVPPPLVTSLLWCQKEHTLSDNSALNRCFGNSVFRGYA